mmetsp:Transcript_16228/g.51827  ORF Transcript_16228/g.51827 Transcript_16228/m.51827 type:complete len:195 (+) Transcript_16228:75-659(+)
MVLRIVPNALTAGTVLCGTVLIVSPALAPLEPATVVSILLLALTLDVLDGAAARVLSVKNPVGGNFDQLADLTCFGIAPAIYFIGQRLRGAGQLGSAKLDSAGEWPGQLQIDALVAFFYVLCSVYRIARELVVHSGKRPLHFVGIPTNLAALLFVPATAYAPEHALLPAYGLVLSCFMVSWFHIPKGLWIVTVR